MEIRSFRPGTSGWRQLEALYQEAFPQPERRPLLRLWLLSRIRREVSLQGWFEGNTLCGFALTVTGSRYLYVAYIAVTEKKRSSGLGTRMLETLHSRRPALTMLVEIEDPQAPADNRQQRLRRAAFYERSGFRALDRTITGGDVQYRLYATDTDYDREAYFDALSRLSLRRHSA